MGTNDSARCLESDKTFINSFFSHTLVHIRLASVRETGDKAILKFSPERKILDMCVIQSVLAS